MYYRQRTKGRLGTAPRPTAKPATYPASVGGINALDSLMGMPPQDCLYCFNLVPSEYSLRLRKGYREWNTLPETFPVNTIIPYEGQAADTAADRMWAVTQSGIWDVTLQGTPPVSPLVTFAAPVTGEAGYGVWVEFTNDAGNRYLQYADAENGLHQYEEATDTWSLPAPTGVTPANVAFVTSWKNRLWYVEQDAADAWYLPVGAITGAATKFTFGAKFSHGGELKGLYSWTRDGGDGVDDFLIAVSRGGDVLVYSGSDPSQPDFGLVGSFYIGEVPESRRLAVSYGSDLFLLSTYGLISLSELMAGVPIMDSRGPSAKINRLLRDNVLAKKDEFSWQLNIHPADGFLQIITPYDTGMESTAIQYVQNTLTGAWGMWKGVPVNCADTWNEFYHIGDREGRVWRYDGTLDGTLLDGTEGEPIDFSILTSFQAPGGNHSSQKRCGIIRTIGVAAGTAALNVDAVYDYNVDYVADAPDALPVSATTLWDTALWDIDLWDFNITGASLPLGALGIGRTIAIAMRGLAAVRINIIGWDILYTEGGFL